MELQEGIGAFVDIFVDTGSSIALIFRRFLPKPLIIRDFQIFHAFSRFLGNCGKLYRPLCNYVTKISLPLHFIGKDFGNLLSANDHLTD